MESKMEEFKSFVKNNPFLISYIKNGAKNDYIEVNRYNEDVNLSKTKDRKNGIYVTIIIILLLIIFSMGMYIFADKSGFFEKVESSEEVNDSEAFLSITVAEFITTSVKEVGT